MKETIIEYDFRICPCCGSHRMLIFEKPNKLFASINPKVTFLCPNCFSRSPSVDLHVEDIDVDSLMENMKQVVNNIIRNNAKEGDLDD